MTEAMRTMPSRMGRLPFYQGFPVPFFSYVDPDGVPDFRVLSPDAMQAIVTKNLCGICGQGLGQRKVFVGGPVSCEQTRVFSDPPFHEECARYAFTICPFLLNPNAKHADRDQVTAKHGWKPGEYGDHMEAIQGHPEKMGLYFTFSYQWSTKHGLFHAGPPIRIEWMEAQR